MNSAINVLENVLYEIEDGLKFDVNTDYLADKFSISATHLRRLFKFSFGQSIGTYIRSRKMALSVYDILNTNINILDIAVEYGHEFEQSYIRAFKREYGLTPGELRKTRQIIETKPPITLLNMNGQTDNFSFGPGVLNKPQFGRYNGLKYEYWQDSGTGAMSLNKNGGFKCKWETSNSAIFRTGKWFGFKKAKRFSNMGTIKVNYGVNYFPDKGSCLCVYGWSINPLIEFYIVENADINTKNYPLERSIVIDGSMYLVNKKICVEQPSIMGTRTFNQYWSIRTAKSSKGVVSVSEHFKAWEKLGMGLGAINEITFAVEGLKSSGTAEVYRNVLTIGDLTIGNASCA